MEIINEILSKGFLLLILIAGLPLMLALISGLTSAVLQAAFGVQEQNLSFVPKIIIVSLIIFLGLPLAFSLMVEYVAEIYLYFPKIKG